jgi:hypothetical protein
MAEVATIRIHYGYCSLCACPVKLQWTLSDDKKLTGDRDGYWKIIGHFGCRNNHKAEKPEKGAENAFNQAVLEKAARFITEARWPPKPPSRRQTTEQLSLFE